MDADETGDRRRRLLLGALLLALVGAVVAWVDFPVLSGRATWLDDKAYVTRNPLVMSPSWTSVTRFVTEVGHPSTVSGYYQPLTMISLMLDRALGGAPDDWRPFHRTNLVLHVIDTMLIVVLLMLLFGEPVPAAMAGLLFGIHPLTVEPLAWIAERKTLLATGCALAALIAYVRYAQRRAAGAEAAAAGRPVSVAAGWYLASVVAYALALLAKPTTTPLPILLLLLDYWPLRRPLRGAIAEKIPFFALGALGGLVTLVSQRNAGSIEYPVAGSPTDTVLTVCHNIIFYLGKMVWPANLQTFYLYPDPMSVQDPMVLAGVIGTGLLGLAVVLSVRWTRAVLSAALMFLIALFPTIGVVRVTSPIASEKYAYFPSLAIVILCAWLLARLWAHARRGPRGRRAMQALICAVVLGLASAEAAATRRYLRVWQDDETLYTHVLRHAPRAWWLQFDYADILAGQGRMDEALGHYLEAEAGDPTDVDVQQHLGNTLMLLGRTDEAIIRYRKAVELQPDNDVHLYNLGFALAQRGDVDDAVAALQAALRLNPGNVSANNQLGVMLAQQGHYEQAIPYFRAALSARPDLVGARVNLADSLQAIGRLDDAIGEYQAALQLNPDDAAVHNNLGTVLLKRGLDEEAIAQFRTALRLRPGARGVEANLRAAVARRALFGDAR